MRLGLFTPRNKRGRSLPVKIDKIPSALELERRAVKTARWDRVKELWLAGDLSQAGIAEVMGVSTNTVVGIIDRLGLRALTRSAAGEQRRRRKFGTSIVRENSSNRPKRAREAPRKGDTPSGGGKLENARNLGGRVGAKVRWAKERAARDEVKPQASDAAIATSDAFMLTRIVAFIELADNQCHWPLACVDMCGGGIYCGALKEPGRGVSPYCVFHADVARGKGSAARVRRGTGRLMIGSHT